MRIVDLIHKDATAGKWHSRSVVYGGTTYRQIYHYSTMMLEVNVDMGIVTNWNIGHGSVSDQMGVNKLLKALDAPWYYRRKGSARIEPLAI